MKQLNTKFYVQIKQIFFSFIQLFQISTQKIPSRNNSECRLITKDSISS